MERFPLGEYGLHSATRAARDDRSEEARLRRHAALRRRSALRRSARVRAMLNKAHAAERARALIDPAKAAVRRAAVGVRRPDRRPRAATRSISPSIDRDGNIVSLIQSIYQRLRQRHRPAGHRASCCTTAARCSRSRTGIPTCSRRASGRCTRSFPAFMERGDVKIGFGIMGGWNQAQAHAQFVSNIVDYGMDIQEALEAGRFTKLTFDGLRRAGRSARARSRRARELTRARPRRHRRAAAHRNVRLRAGGDERRRRRALRRVGAAARRRRDPRGAACVRHTADRRRFVVTNGARLKPRATAIEKSRRDREIASAERPRDQFRFVVARGFSRASAR